MHWELFFHLLQKWPIIPQCITEILWNVSFMGGGGWISSPSLPKSDQDKLFIFSDRPHLDNTKAFFVNWPFAPIICLLVPSGAEILMFVESNPPPPHTHIHIVMSCISYKAITDRHFWCSSLSLFSIFLNNSFFSSLFCSYNI